MSLITIVLIILLFMLVGVLPAFFLSKRWKYYPSIFYILLFFIAAILLSSGIVKLSFVLSPL
jgi:hypothetical protein